MNDFEFFGPPQSVLNEEKRLTNLSEDTLKTFYKTFPTVCRKTTPVRVQNKNLNIKHKTKSHINVKKVNEKTGNSNRYQKQRGDKGRRSGTDSSIYNTLIPDFSLSQIDRIKKNFITMESPKRGCLQCFTYLRHCFSSHSATTR